MQVASKSFFLLVQNTKYTNKETKYKPMANLIESENTDSSSKVALCEYQLMTSDC